jgi:signal transduction histidine kinase
VDLNSLAHAIADELQARDPARQVEFIIAESLIAQGDEHLLRIALQNLLENAWKFSSTRPHAIIEVGQMTAADAHMPHAEGASDPSPPDGLPSQSAIFYVRDNGVGFDMAYASKLFAPFQRLHAMHEFPGTGIGLAIVQRVIARHGGRIWPIAHVGEGAAFYFIVGDPT